MGAASVGYGYDALGRLTAINRASEASTTTVGYDTAAPRPHAATLGRSPNHDTIC